MQFLTELSAHLLKYRVSARIVRLICYGASISRSIFAVAHFAQLQMQVHPASRLRSPSVQVARISLMTRKRGTKKKASPLPPAPLAVAGFLVAGLVAWEYSDRLAGLLDFAV